MTQKELAYVEDAIGHETNIIKICNSALKKIDDDSLITFMNSEIEKHENMKQKLMSLLGGKTSGQ